MLITLTLFTVVLVVVALAVPVGVAGPCATPRSVAAIADGLELVRNTRSGRREARDHQRCAQRACGGFHAVDGHLAGRPACFALR